MAGCSCVLSSRRKSGVRSIRLFREKTEGWAKFPLPWRLVTKPSESSTCIASRTVARLIWSEAAISSSGGRRLSPARMPRICSNSA